MNFHSDRVSFRLVEKVDIELIYYWRQNYEIYRYFKLQKEQLVWIDHLTFWDSYNNRKDWIILFENRRVGSVYFKILNHEELDIGIYIADLKLHGKGIGSASLDHAINWAKANHFSVINAEVHNKNIPSIKMFEKKGFSINTSPNDGEYYIYKLFI